jgi:hypothetical protein
MAESDLCVRSRGRDRCQAGEQDDNADARNEVCQREPSQAGSRYLEAGVGEIEAQLNGA